MCKSRSVALNRGICSSSLKPMASFVLQTTSKIEHSKISNLNQPANTLRNYAYVKHGRQTKTSLLSTTPVKPRFHNRAPTKQMAALIQATMLDKLKGIPSPPPPSKYGNLSVVGFTVFCIVIHLLRLCFFSMFARKTYTVI